MRKFPVGTIGHKDIKIADKRQISKSLKRYLFFVITPTRCFKDIITNKQANDSASNFLKKKIRQVVKNKEFAEILTNFDHPYGCKRPPIDTNYFETYNRDNVHLVDIKKDPIIEIDKTGIKTESFLNI